MLERDTIVAIATPIGKGGVGIVRLSGSNAYAISQKITQTILNPRYAHYCNFFEGNKNTSENIIDSGIAIFFKSPHSFTGEDVIEFQGHGGPIVLDLLLKECVVHGARLARPGEFSERAFLNDKIDLTQAEAIADLIDSNSVEAARNATRSLQGDFSKKINALVNNVINLRIYTEAAIDFPDEEIDFLNDGNVKKKLGIIIDEIEKISASANQGVILREGIRVVIAGKPNAGKSSLLNALAGNDVAIVTDIAGTTRDTLKEFITIDGLPLHIIDTAGIHESNDIIELEGIKRARKAIEDADVILVVSESMTFGFNDLISFLPEFNSAILSKKLKIIVRNKCDINNISPNIHKQDEGSIITLSAKKLLGIDLLKQELKFIAGYNNKNEINISARRRHIDSLTNAKKYLIQGMLQLDNFGAGELLAEDLKFCQKHLNEITGEYTTDDLLGNIFSSFCIGK